MKIYLLLLLIPCFLGSVYAQQPNVKRGICFGGGSAKIEDIETISGALSWSYNWGTAAESYLDEAYVTNNVDFVPMAWNGNFDEAKIRNYYSTHPNAKYLLGFNEPNFTAQANMTPSQAAAKWPLLESIANDYGLEIVGPAVNWCGNCVSENGITYNNPYDYYDDFFAACPDCKVDYIAVHNYMCYSGPLIGYLEGFKKYGKKIWLTEFACWDQPTITLAMQKSLMLGALDYLDNDTMIYRYSWFIGRAGSNTPDITLFENEPGKLSELGELYLNYRAVHDNSYYTTVPERIEAENYSIMDGVALELTSDFDGIANVGWIDAGDWLQYNIDAEETSDYFLYLRVSANGATSFEVWVDDTIQSTIQIASTGGWQNWKTFKSTVTLNKGKSHLKLIAPSGSLNINWLRISTQDNAAPVCSAGTDIEITEPTNSVDLTGTASDENGDNLQYIWTKISGGTYTFDAPNELTNTAANLVSGTYTFRLTVYDGYETVYDDVKVKVNKAVGIDNIENVPYMQIYPNPTNDWVTFNFKALQSQAEIEIYSLNGKLIKTIPLSKGETSTTLKTDTIEKGIYFIKLVQNGKVLANSKMVITD